MNTTKYFCRVTAKLRDGRREDVEMSDHADAQSHANQLEAEGATEIRIFEQEWKLKATTKVERWAE